MNRKVLVAAVGAFALGVVVAPAAAQTSKPVGLSIRAGVVFPTDSSVRNAIGKTLFGAGVEFKVSDANTGMGAPNQNGHISVSADYYGKNNASNIPVLVNYVGMSNEFFYSVGAGVAFTRGGGSNNTNFAYQFGVGYNFQHSQTPVFLEAKYWGNSKSAANAIGVYLGVRL
jgi:hypothetical protein